MQKFLCSMVNLLTFFLQKDIIYKVSRIYVIEKRGIFMKIKIGIAGYGNLGRGVECAILQNPDMELFGVFTRRNPTDVKTLTNASVYHIDDIESYKDKLMF